MVSAAHREDSAEFIGEYEVVSPLATGGMAEVVLARLSGPAGFERPVVVKRILPHLASEAAFRDMFLDEARIVARIQHRNVVQVHKLGTDEGQLYLVMEYLDGETLASLNRRCTRDDVMVPPAICAHIIAEACAGLHAAHELTHPDGTPTELVHRDIAPANIIAGFDGSVKLLDFGIAKARDRISKTEAGQLKGRYSYMSPEQASGEFLDRRSDIFSLGIVLYEISTGRRLFQRPNPIMSMKAVAEAVVPPPNQFMTGYPRELETVFRRALALERSDRYATAAEFRSALIKAQRAIDPTLVGDVALRDLMVERLPDRLSKKKKLLVSLSRGERVAVLPTEVDEDVQQLTVPFVDGGTFEPPVPAKLRWPIAAAAAALLLLGGVVYAALESDEPSTSSEAATFPRTGVASNTANEPREPAIERSETVELELLSEPAGAEVTIEGIEEPFITPSAAELVASEDPVRLRFALDGHVPAERSLVLREDRTVRVELTPIVSTESETTTPRRRVRRERRVAPAEPEASREPAREPVTTPGQPSSPFEAW